MPDYIYFIITSPFYGVLTTVMFTDAILLPLFTLPSSEIHLALLDYLCRCVDLAHSVSKRSVLRTCR